MLTPNSGVVLPCGAVLALALVSAACGGDGGTTQTTGPEATTAVTGAGTGTSTGTGPGATTDVPTTGGSVTGTGGTTGPGGSTGGDATSTGAGSSGGTTEVGTGTTMGAVTQTTGGETGGGSSTGGMEVLPVLPSAGCGVAGSPVGHMTGLKTTVDGVDRSYDMFVPKPYDANKPHALIFTYHGVGGTANTNQLKLDTFSTANDGFSINVAPQGWATAEWNEIHFVPFNLEASLVVFDQVLAKLAAEYCIDLNRVFATGHSNGGQMSFHLGCMRGDVVRAVFPSGGRCFSYGPGVCDPDHDAAHQCVGDVMVMSVMGEDDVERHADEEATLAGFVARQGCTMVKEPVDPSPCLRFAGCDSGAEVETCRIPGLAHQIWKDGLDDVYAVMMSL